MIRELLSLSYSPIAIGLGCKPPSGVPQLKGRMEFCRMWVEAQKGKAFFVTVENYDCLPGMYHLGLYDEGKRGAVCRFWVEQVYAYSHDAVRKYVAALPHLKRELVSLICMSPLEKTSFKPDLVIIRCNPEQAMLLLWAHSYNTGEVVQGETGTSMCSSLIVKPYLTRKPSFTVGDPGGRYIIGLTREEIMVSIPYHLHDIIVKTLKLHIQDWQS